MKSKMIAICAGGTGGHVFPAVAMGERFIKDGYKVMVLLDKRAYGFKEVWSDDIEIFKIASLGLHKKSIFYLMKVFAILMIGFFKTFFIFVTRRPAVLLSFGGYSSIPPVMGAILLRIPIVMHEQNAVLGKSHRIFKRFAKKIALSFHDTKLADGERFKVTGLPIRKVFFESLGDKEEIKDYKIVVLVLGGSQGAAVFGENIPKAFLLMDSDKRKKFKVYHQCRKEYAESSKLLWEESGIKYIMQPFFNNISIIMQESDIIITRSGSSTIAEIGILGKRALYVPFKRASDNHQELNARNVVKDCGADMLLEDDFSPLALKEYLENRLDEGVDKLRAGSSVKKDKAVESLKELVIDIIGK